MVTIDWRYGLYGAAVINGDFIWPRSHETFSSPTWRCVWLLKGSTNDGNGMAALMEDSFFLFTETPIRQHQTGTMTTIHSQQSNSVDIAFSNGAYLRV